MSKNCSKEKSFAPSPEDLEVEKTESSTKIKHRVYTEAASKKMKSDLETKTKDKHDRKSRKRSRDEDDKKSCKGQSIQSDIRLLLLSEDAISRERSALRNELTENQEILMKRQGRVTHLEMQFRTFQGRRFSLSSERWLAEKVIREDQILESRELLTIQLERCRRLHRLLQFNEQRMIDLDRVISKKEKILLQNTQRSEGDRTLPGMEERKMKERKMKEETSEKDASSAKVKSTECIEKKMETTRSAPAKDESRRQKEIQEQKFNLKLTMDEHQAVEAEMRRREAVRQRMRFEQAYEQRLEMEQAIRDQEVLNDSKIRSALMQQSIEARKHYLMTQEDLPKPFAETFSQVTLKKPGNFREILRMPPIVAKLASPDVPKSIIHSEEGKEIIVIDGDDDDDKKLLPAETKSNEDVAAATATATATAREDNDDEDFIVI